MNIRYRVDLSEAERLELEALLSGGKHAAHKLERAQIHQMILTLEKAGLISRRPAAARAIAILVDPAKLPDLAPGYEEPVETSVLRY